MTSELGLTRGSGFEPPLYNLFPILKVHEGLRLVRSTLHMQGMGPPVREGDKKHDTHINPKSYKLELLGKLVV